MTVDGPPAGLVDLVEAARAGSRRALGRLLSIAEDAATGPTHGASVLRTDLAAATRPERPGPRLIGLTGPPGVGKSSVAAALAEALADRGRRVIVLAVDPTSPVTGGALLGDRIRFAAREPHGPSGADRGSTREGLVTVRSMASRGHVGGLAAAVPLALAVARAVGLDDVVVETVGAGQGDISVTALVETTVLVVAPGLGDEIQSLKAGIAELADVICVNKADLAGAAEAVRHWRIAARSATADGAATGALPTWLPPVVTAKGRDGDVTDLLVEIDRHGAWLVAPGQPGRTQQLGAHSRHGTAADTWRGVTEAAAAGDLATTLTLLGEAVISVAKARAGSGVAPAGLLVAAGLDHVITAADLDPARLTTRDGLLALVAAVRGRVDQ